MSLASLEAFLERAHDDERLRELLCTAPDAASVAAIARAAGFPVSELDLWRASAAIPDELQPSAADLASSGADLAPSTNPLSAAGDAAEAPTPAGPLPDPWLEDDPLSRFVHQAHGDEELQRALATAPDAAAVAAIAQAAGYPISEVDLWLASGVTPEELAASHHPVADATTTAAAAAAVGTDDPTADAAPAVAEELSLKAGARENGAEREEGDGVEEGDRQGEGDGPREGLAEWLEAVNEEEREDENGRQEGVEEGEGASQPAMDREAPVSDLSLQASMEDAIRRFLQQAEDDEALQQALASAPDAAAVAAIAQGAGHPISELALWLASGAAFEEAMPELESPSPADDPLSCFLRAVEVDPDLRIALASAPDAATVAAIARIAGFPVTTADLWAASDADPHALALEEVILEEMVVVVDG